MILDTDAYIYDAANFVTNGRTNGRMDKAILGVGRNQNKERLSESLIYVLPSKEQTQKY